MPEGISVIIDDEGYANITFENRALRGPALDRLIEIGGPGTVDKSTEHGYPVYRVPEGNARAAGLLATAGVADDLPTATLLPDEKGVHTILSPLPPEPGTVLTPAQTEHVERLTELLDNGGTSQTEEEKAAADGTQPAPAEAPETPAAPEVPGAPAEKKYPEGEPTTEWKLLQLKAYAADHGKDAEELRTKAEVLELINSK
jgi:hypothetical protein